MNTILCVDDDQNLLSAFQRVLRHDYTIVTATSGEEGLLRMQEQGPFPLVISDERMPGMGGVQFLAKVRELSPDTVRIMLTGLTDQQTAINAINEGHVFRMLTKPCPPELLAKSVAAGLEQYRLVTAERVLLEDTLKGSINVLVETLSLVNPSAFSHAMRIRDLMRQIVAVSQLSDAWQYDVAAMLSQIGCVTVPGQVMARYFAGSALSQTELEMIAVIPNVGSKLVVNIPRLETVAAMIANQQYSAGYWAKAKCDRNAPDVIGAELLKMIGDFSYLLARMLPQMAIKEIMERNAEQYNPRYLSTLSSLIIPKVAEKQMLVHVTDLKNGMIIAEDVCTTNGIMLVCRGYEVTDMLLQRLRNFLAQGLVKNSILIMQ